MGTTYVLGEHLDLVVANSTVMPWEGKDRIHVLSNRIDFSGHHVTGDTDGMVEVLAIPINTLVLAVWAYVHTVDAAITDLDIGLGAGAEFMDGFSCATAGYKLPAAGASSPGFANPGMFFATADTIDIAIQGTAEADTLDITVFALCVDLTII